MKMKMWNLNQTHIQSLAYSRTCRIRPEEYTGTPYFLPLLWNELLVVTPLFV